VQYVEAQPAEFYEYPDPNYDQPPYDDFQEGYTEPAYETADPYPAPNEQYEPVEAPVTEGFRPPYADPNVRTGFSTVNAPVEEYEYQQPYPEYPEEEKPYDPQSYPQTYPQSYPQYEEDIEPTDTDFDDAADLDEGTVVGSRPHPKEEYKQFQPKRKPQPPVQQSPRMKVAKEVDHKQFREDQNNEWKGISEIEDNEGDLSRDEWKNIQRKIDVEYEKKLKEVSDEAMKKLKNYQAEHKALLEKTQFLLDNSQVKSRSGSRAGGSRSRSDSR
jgi:hypothetical protein